MIHILCRQYSMASILQLFDIFSHFESFFYFCFTHMLYIYYRRFLTSLSLFFIIVVTVNGLKIKDIQTLGRVYPFSFIWITSTFVSREKDCRAFLTFLDNAGVFFYLAVILVVYKIVNKFICLTNAQRPASISRWHWNENLSRNGRICELQGTSTLWTGVNWAGVLVYG